MSASTPRILAGGQKLKISEVNRHFISAYVTDTRLMGVLAVYAHWHLDTLKESEPGKGNAASDMDNGSASSDPVTWGTLHQFFYIDCEETGLETYYEIRVNDTKKVEEREQTMIGGLGASKIDLSETELRQLMCRYRVFNLQRGLPMPTGLDNYGFLFTPNMTPDPGQQQALMERICTKIFSVYQLINYFLMRCFGQDHEGARFLALDDTVPVDLYDRYVRATFCRNVIDRKPSEQTPGADKRTSARDSTCGSPLPQTETREYLCESLVEMDGRYEVIVSHVLVRDRKIAGLEYCSGFPVSTSEAALILRKTEYVNVYELLLSEEELEENIDEFSVGFHATMTRCENGLLFMAYRPNNGHVNRPEFQLNNDVAGVYFLSDGGQLITAAYSVEDAGYLGMTLKKSVLAPYLLPHGKYKFIEPVLFEFIHGDIERFETFLHIFSGKEE